MSWVLDANPIFRRTLGGILVGHQVFLVWDEPSVWLPLMFCGIDSKVFSKDIITSQVLLTLRDIPRFYCNHFRFGMKHKAWFGCCYCARCLWRGNTSTAGATCGLLVQLWQHDVEYDQWLNAQSAYRWCGTFTTYIIVWQLWEGILSMNLLSFPSYIMARTWYLYNSQVLCDLCPATNLQWPMSDSYERLMSRFMEWAGRLQNA